MASEVISEEPSRVRRRPGGWFVTAVLVLFSAVFLVLAACRLLGLDPLGTSLLGGVGQYLVMALALTPYVAVVGVLLGALGLLLRRRILGGIVLVVAVIMVSAVLPRAISNPQKSGTGQQLRIMSANLYLGRADAAALVGLVRSGRVDVLSLQELTPAAVTALDQAGLGQELPYRVFAAEPGASGSGLASRFPLRALDPKEIGAEPSTFTQPAAVVDLPGTRDLEMMAVHTQPALGPVRTATWSRELAGLPAADTKSRNYRLLAGDFNATLDHVGLRELIAKGYEDVADQRGGGLSPTWPEGAWPPPVTIDHILVDGEMPVEYYEVYDLPGSDHNALYARVIVPS